MPSIAMEGKLNVQLDLSIMPFFYMERKSYIYFL